MGAPLGNFAKIEAFLVRSTRFLADILNVSIGLD